MHRQVTKHAEYIVSISGRRGLNLKPPALAWAWLPENMTWVIYTWGQFSHMRPPPTSPAMQLHSTHGNNVIPPSASQNFSAAKLQPANPCCKDLLRLQRHVDFDDLPAMLQETCIEHQTALGANNVNTGSTNGVCNMLIYHLRRYSLMTQGSICCSSACMDLRAGCSCPTTA